MSETLNVETCFKKLCIFLTGGAVRAHPTPLVCLRHCNAQLDDVVRNRAINPLTPTVAIWVQPLKHPVPGLSRHL